MLARIANKLIPLYILIKLLRVTKIKLKINEGLNQIYALKAKSVKEMLEPVSDFPAHTHPYFRDYLGRLPYQMNPNILTTLYTLRKLMDKNKEL